MAYLIRYFVSSVTTVNTSKVYLGAIQDLSPNLEIGLMTIGIPLSSGRSAVVMDINGAIESWSVTGTIFGDASNECSNLEGATAHNVWSADYSRIDVTTAANKNYCSTWIKMMKLFSINQISNLGSTTQTDTTGGLWFVIEATDVNTNSFPTENVRCYISNFTAKYIAGVPNAVDYTFTVTLAGAL